MAVQVSSDATCSDDEDLAFVDAIISNHLPCDVLVDEVDTLPPGQSTVTLSCPTSSWGLYALESSEVVMSHLHFRWQHTGTMATTSKRNHVSLVRVPRSLHTLDVQTRQPQQTELGTTSRLLLVISTDQNDILWVTITPVDTDIVFFPKGELLFIAALKKIGLSVMYSTQSSPGVIRTLQTSRVVTVSLPIAVNVEHFFRGKRLFSKFTISTTSHQYVRISSTELQGPPSLDGVKISGCRPSRPVVTVTPEHPVNFLLSIESSNGPVLEPLNLIIKYRILRDGEDSLTSSVALTATSYSELVAHLESDAEWVETYRATGEIVLPHSFEDGGDFQGPIREALAQCRSETASPCPWREIKIPVDVPRMNIVTAAQIAVQPSLPSDTRSDQLLPIYAGQPIPATLIFKTSFHWAEKEGKQRSYKMRYNVEEHVKDWLLCGRKRGDFVATMPMSSQALWKARIAAWTKIIDQQSLNRQRDS
ncbi:uncharacterized protein EDB91DRAFT_1281560 [Suillus paluster]|uniref:uncharacterized protein n=1 Tax=Suillus paluster TaxID=48578 RepID=UPI001B86FC40|nr:uncharacterized protein EDB91DRAFT_1281560 [Suillus paluster]KAG1740808.1 hypothetical protein EDB91DRAFT_1281560 [Suillus paluster]